MSEFVAKPGAGAASGPSDLDEGQYASIFAGAPDGILVVDQSGQIVATNGRASDQFGYDKGELAGTSLEALVPPQFRGKHADLRAQFDPAAGWRPMGAGLAISGVRKDGTEFPIEISLAALDGGQDTYVVASVRDLSDWDRGRKMRSATIRATERERHRISAELHDDTLQHCAALLIQLRLLANGTPPELGDRILEVRNQLEGVARKIRRIASGLRPPELDQVGIEGALRAWIRIQEGLGEKPRFRINMERVDESLSHEERLTVFRILQEAITNAVNHAEASLVEVNLKVQAGRVVGSVSDDGTGFDFAEARDRPAGLGLAGMLERANMIGAELRLDTRIHHGSSVEVRVGHKSSSSTEEPSP